MIDVDRGVVRLDHAIPGLARGAGRRGRALRLRHQFSRPRPPHLSSSTTIRPTQAARRSAPARPSSEGKHWGGPFPYNDGPVAVEAAPAHPSASAIFAGRLARRVHLRPHRPRADLRSDAGAGHDRAAMLESQRVRAEIRAGRITGTSRGLAHGFVQCNLAILPKDYAFDFPALLPAQSARLPGPGSHRSRQRPVPKKLAPTGGPAHRLRALRGLS